MSGRIIFSPNEKVCLQELIIKYHLNSATTHYGFAKKGNWQSLVEEYNSIESNTKRTEVQLKKLWDNLKTRKKAQLAQEKKERMRTGGGPFWQTPGPSNAEYIDEAVLPVTDIEMGNVVDSDNLPPTVSQLELSNDKENVPPSSQPDTEALLFTTPVDFQTVTEDPVIDRGGRGQFLDCSRNETQTSVGGAKNIRSRVIADEFAIRQLNYERAEQREEELHALKVAEQTLLLKKAEEELKKAEIERRAAEELLRCNAAKRQEAELMLQKKEC